MKQLLEEQLLEEQLLEKQLLEERLLAKQLLAKRLLVKRLLAKQIEKRLEYHQRLFAADTRNQPPCLCTAQAGQHVT